MSDASILDFLEPGHDLVEANLAAELQCLLGESLHQVFGEHFGKARNVEDVFLGVQRHQLAAEGGEGIHQAA